MSQRVMISPSLGQWSLPVDGGVPNDEFEPNSILKIEFRVVRFQVGIAPDIVIDQLNDRSIASWL